MTMIKKLIRRGKQTRDYYVIFGVTMPDGKRKKVQLTTNMRTRNNALEVGQLKEALWKAENRALPQNETSDLTLSSLRKWDLKERQGTSDYLGHKAMWNAILRTHSENKPLPTFDPDDFFQDHIKLRSKEVKSQTWRREVLKMKHIIKQGIRLCAKGHDTAASERLSAILVEYPSGIPTETSTSNLRGKIHPPVILERFFAALPQGWRNCYQFARNTGIRSYELRRMTYNMIRLGSDGTWVAVLPASSTKGREGREVTLNRIAVGALQSQRDLNPLASHIWPEWDRDVMEKAIRDIAYFDEQGEPFMIYLRDMRHEFATNATLKSSDHKAVRDMLGHKSSQMTERYLHSNLARKKAVTQILEDETISESHISLRSNHALPLTSNLFKSEEKPKK
jgi:integrase